MRVARGPSGSGDFNSTWAAVGGCDYSNGYHDRLPFRSFFDDDRTSEAGSDNSDWFCKWHFPKRFLRVLLCCGGMQ